MVQALTIIIVDKTGILKTLAVKDFKVEDLYKKCGFKNPDGFKMQAEWSIKLEQTFVVQVYGKTDGKANMENKYDFPPPVDTTLFFGACALICFSDISKKHYYNLSIKLWERMYEKLFGGFDDLNEDDEEDDELDEIPKKSKTKVGGYLKDGFVVDSDNEVASNSSSDDESDKPSELEPEADDDDVIEDVGSELSEEEYED